MFFLVCSVEWFIYAIVYSQRIYAQVCCAVPPHPGFIHAGLLLSSEKLTNKGMGLFWTLWEFWVFSTVWVVVCCKLTATNIFPREKLKWNYFLIDYIWNPGVPDLTWGNLFFPTVLVTEHWHRLPRWAMAYPSPLEILKSHLDMVLGNWLQVILL